MTDCCCANGGRRGPHAAAPPVELATRNAGQPTRAWALHTHLFSKVSGQGRAGQGRAVESTAELQGSAGQSTAGQRSKTERSSVEQARTCSARGRRSRGRCQWRCCSLPAPAAACPGGSARCRGCLREGGREGGGRRNSGSLEGRFSRGAAGQRRSCACTSKHSMVASSAGASASFPQQRQQRQLNPPRLPPGSAHQWCIAVQVHPPHAAGL